MATLFLSDLHLSADTPAFNDRFAALLGEASGRIDALYLLGDLFDAWLGDDDDTPFSSDLQARLAAFTAITPVRVMNGNRDFLIGRRFAARTGVSLLDDPATVTLYDRRYLLSHGDSLCTDDVAYQRYRAAIRRPARRWLLEHLPLSIRRAIARTLRARSQADKAGKPAAIMDVNATAVASLLAAHPGATLIHGHTHRPGHHYHRVGRDQRERWVLPDWRPGQMGGLWVDAGGPRFSADPLADLVALSSNN